MIHFVGFKDDRVHTAIRVFGRPDFWHRRWDRRAVDEVAEGDVVIFADGDETSPVDPFAFDDSAVAPGDDSDDDVVEFGGVKFHRTQVTATLVTLTPVDDPCWFLRAIQDGRPA